MSAATNDTRFEESTFLYTWNIQEFQKCSLDSHNKIKSAPFEFEECLYHLELYQAYVHCVTSLYATICIDRHEADSNTKKYFQFSYMEDNGVLNEKSTEEMKKDSCSTEICNWSYIKDVIKDKCLTINCKITHRHMIQRISKPKDKGAISCQRMEKLVQDMENLLSCKEKADMYLEVEGENIPTHSTILRARSPFFASILKDNPKRRMMTVKIEGFDSVIIHYILTYIYTGKLEQLKDLSSDLLTKLYNAAQTYEMVELKEMCTEFMMFNISNENIEICISLAEQADDRNMLNLIADFVATDPMKTINSLQWEDLVKKQPQFSTMVIERCWEKMCKVKQMDV